jgi:hypothetical protein
MIKQSLREFVDRVLDAGEITENDVRLLYRDVLPFDVTCREEADVLIALDRAIIRQHELWSEAMVRLVVDFAVWVSRPTGIVDAELASWLVTSLGSAGGPTPNAMKVVFEIVNEAQQVDEALMAFALRGLQAQSTNRVSRLDWQNAIPAANAA